MTAVTETVRHAVPIADAGSGAVAVGVGMIAIDPTTTTTGLLRPGIMMMTAPGPVAVVAVVEESIVAVLRDVVMVIEADIVRLIGKGHEVGRSSIRIRGQAFLLILQHNVASDYSRNEQQPYNAGTAPPPPSGSVCFRLKPAA